MAVQLTNTGTLGLVNPLSLPDGSSVNYNNGDVQHLSPISGLDAASISNVTRQLAYRDTALAEKVNELVSVVNNKEQLMNLPAVRTSLAPGDVIVVTNYRIPPGYEARMLNAIVSSTPIAQQVLLEIFYNLNQFGNTNGTTTVVSTVTESGSGTSFYGTGEFVVQLTNIGTTPTDAIASVLMTLRPTNAQAGGIIGPGITGQQGIPGVPGVPGVGQPGAPGTPGTPGLIWKGVYSNTVAYSPPMCVSYAWGGTLGTSSYVNRAACQGVLPPVPSLAPSTYWGLLASGAQGATGIGATGSQGFQYAGYFNAGTQYIYGSVVLNGTGTNQTVVYYNNGVTTSNIPPAAPWVPLFGPFTGPTYVSTSLPTLTVQEAGYQPGTTTAGYTAPAIGGSYYFPFTELVIFGGPPAQTYSSMNWLQGRAALSYYGNLQINLPTITSGARANWTTSDTTISANVHGAPLVFGGTVPLVTVVSMGGSAWNVNAWGTNQVEIVIEGQKPANAIS